MSSRVLANINASTIADIVVRTYMPNVFPPILESFDVSLKFEIPDTKTKLRQQLILILTNIVPKASHSLLYNYNPINTDAMPKEVPILNQKLFYYEAAYLSFYSVNKDQQLLSSTTIGTALGTTWMSSFTL